MKASPKGHIAIRKILYVFLHKKHDDMRNDH